MGLLFDAPPMKLETWQSRVALILTLVHIVAFAMLIVLSLEKDGLMRMVGVMLGAIGMITSTLIGLGLSALFDER